MGTVDLTIGGPHGSAARDTPDRRRDDGFAVDVWTLRPRLSDPVTLIGCRVLRGPHETYAVVLASIDTTAARRLRELGLPTEMAYDVHLVAPMTVHTDAQAREVTAHLARQTTVGTLTARPDSDADRHAWEAVITALARVTVHGPRPGGFRAGAAATVTS